MGHTGRFTSTYILALLLAGCGGRSLPADVDGYSGTGSDGSESSDAGTITASSGLPSTGSPSSTGASDSDGTDDDWGGSVDTGPSWSGESVDTGPTWSEASTDSTQSETDSTWAEESEASTGTGPWGDGDGDGDLTCPPHWIDQFGSTQPDFGLDAELAANGDLILAGHAGAALPGVTGFGGPDVFVARYTPDGERLWLRQHGTPGTEEAHALATHPVHGTFIAGKSDSSWFGQSNAGSFDAFVAKLDEQGEIVWVRHLGSSGYDQAKALAIGPDGSLYVAGDTDGNLAAPPLPGTRNAWVARLSPDGDTVWIEQSYDAIGDGVTALALDGNALYYTGERYTGPVGALSGASHAYVTRRALTGALSWTRRIEEGITRGYGLTAGGGRIYVNGSTTADLSGEGHSGSGDAFVRAYESDGSEAWTRQLGTGSTDYGTGLTLTADQQYLYAIGTTLGGMEGNSSAGFGDIFVTKFFVDGAKVWTHQFGTNSLDRGWDVVVRPSGEAFAAGSTEGLLAGDILAGGWDVFAAELCEL